MRILAIDSSSFPASAAIVDEEKILGEFFINTKLTHSQTLMPMIDSVLKMTKTAVDSIDLIAVTNGPGSFTGVRIGVASAKGISVPFNIPCCGISALEALAYNFVNSPDDKIICCSMDARCGQVYNALFMVDDGKITRLTEDRTISIDDLALEMENYDSTVYLLGDGAELCYEKLKELGTVLVPENLRYQRASSAGYSAIVHYNKGDYLTAAELQPMYLQLPQAQRELNAKRNKKEGL